jgi:hypothetical protein
VACAHLILDSSLAQYPFQSTSKYAVRPFYFSHLMCTHEFKVEHRDVSFVYIPPLFFRIMHYHVPSSVPFLSTDIVVAVYVPLGPYTVLPVCVHMRSR